MIKQNKDKLELLKTEFNELIEKMQSPAARAGAKSVSKATSKDLGKAAAEYRRNEESRK